MEPLLFLAHRLPFPPNKGDKVRSYHFFKHLASRYRVFLGTFIDDAADLAHVPAVQALCAGLHVESIAPLAQRARSVRALLRGEALSLPYFRSRRLASWVSRVIEENNVRRAFVFSSPMAQYTLGRPGLESIVDFVDMDSAKWGEYAARRTWPASAVYGREARTLLAFERQVAAQAAASLFVTSEEAQRFVAAAPECAERVRVVRNGVDAEFFSPSDAFQSPFRAGERPVVFTGAMDYWPNIDAVVWFAREVLAAVRRRDPAAHFYVVGMNPDAAVRALAGERGVTVTGRVQDVRPYLQHAAVVVAPLRVARGVQNKVLEAMSMARPVVATPASAQSLGARAGEEVEVAGEPRSFAEKVLALFDRERGRALGDRARAKVLRDYGWRASLEALDALLEAPARGRTEAKAL